MADAPGTADAAEVASGRIADTMPVLTRLDLHRAAKSRIVFVLTLVPLVLFFSRAASLFGAKTFSPGDAPAAPFFVAVMPRDSAAPFDLVSFKEALESNRALFLSPRDSETLPGKREVHKYRVLRGSQGALVVETVKADDDYTITSRYRIDRGRPIALESRVYGPEHGFAGFALALAFCTLLFWLLRRYTREDGSIGTPEP